MRVVSILATLILVVGLAACGGGGGPSDLNLPSTPTTVAPPTTGPAAGSGPSSAPSTSVVPGLSAALPAVSAVAHARVPLLAVYSSPTAKRTTRELPNPWSADANDPSVLVNQAFLVEDQPGNGWVKVLLPVFPNGTSGWVHAADVTITNVSYGIQVALQARRMTVYSHGSVLWQGAVAVGAPASPTPTGEYYVRAIFATPKPGAVSGPIAFGLSSASGAITSFSGADGEIAVHGATDASSLGSATTLGSIRMPNEEIAKLAALLPLGTPVIISS